MANTQRPALIEIHDLSEIPIEMTEAEEAEFWSIHCLGEELLDQMEPVPEGLLPRARDVEGLPSAVPQRNRPCSAG